MQSPCSGCSLAVRARVQLGSAILPVFSRSPALTAMTAAGLDFVSSGRFILGLGASGPQVVQGWHGVVLRSPAVAHQGDDRCVQVGVGPREVAVRREDHAVTRWRRPTAQAAEPADPSGHPDLHRSVWVRRTSRSRRRWPKGGFPSSSIRTRLTSGARRWPREPAAEIRPSVPWKSSRADRSPSVTTTRPNGSATPNALTWRCTSEAWARSAKLLQRFVRPVRVRRRGACGFRSCTSPARERKRKHSCRPSTSEINGLGGGRGPCSRPNPGVQVGRSHVSEHRDPRLGGRSRGIGCSTAIVWTSE